MELRWDPILREWIIVSGQRKERPVHDQSYCPFCPGSKEVPSADWQVLVLANKYPSLSPNPEPPVGIEPTTYNMETEHMPMFTY